MGAGTASDNKTGGETFNTNFVNSGISAAPPPPPHTHTQSTIYMHTYLPKFKDGVYICHKITVFIKTC